MGKYILAAVVAIVLVAGAGYGGYRLGVQDGEQQAASVRENFFAQRGGTPVASNQGGNQGTFTPGQGFSGGGTFAGRGGTAATIKSIEGNTIIVSTAESELEVDVTPDTRITMTTDGSVSDLTVGERIFISGDTSGNKMTASQIQVMSEVPQLQQQ
jgi:hypothetical protein